MAAANFCELQIPAAPSPMSNFNSSCELRFFQILAAANFISCDIYLYIYFPFYYKPFLPKNQILFAAAFYIYNIIPFNYTTILFLIQISAAK
jgi:hypothetical protein